MGDDFAVKETQQTCFIVAQEKEKNRIRNKREEKGLYPVYVYMGIHARAC